MGFKFLNFELQMLRVMNCTKLTNAWVINSAIDICIFQVSITVFKDQSGGMIFFKAFQGLENLYIKFQDFRYVSRICTNRAHRTNTLYIYTWCSIHKRHVGYFESQESSRTLNFNWIFC